jgi:hypothetical protein
MAFYYSPKIITEGLVLYLDAANTKSYPTTGTAWNDLSRGGNDGTLTNGPTFNSENGGSIVFDGVDDYVNLGTISQIAPGTGDFTVEFWINPTNWSSTFHPIFITTITNGLWIGKNASNFVLRTYDVADDLQYATFPTVNIWTNVIVRRNGTTANIYYNTVSVTSGTVTRNYVQGVSEIARDGTVNVFNGKISNIKYYNRAISSSEILQNYNATKSRFGL